MNLVIRIQTFKYTGINTLKFCFEGMEESGSLGLDEELVKRKDTFLNVNN